MGSRVAFFLLWPLTRGEAMRLNERLHNIDCSPQQFHRRLQCAKGGAGGKRDTFHLGRWMFLVEWFGGKHVEAAMAQVATFERVDQCLVDERAARAVLIRIAPGFMRAMRCLEMKPRISSLSTRLIETTSARSSSVPSRPAGRAHRRAVLGDHRHADAGRDAGDLAADAAEPDHAQRFVEKLHAFLRCLRAAAHRAVHARHIARCREHERNCVFEHRGVTIARDGVHVDAARRAPRYSCSSSPPCREKRYA